MMTRLDMFITSKQKKKLEKAIELEIGTSKSDIIRRAIDDFLDKKIKEEVKNESNH